MTSAEFNNMFYTLNKIEKELEITNDRQFCKSVYSKCDVFKNSINTFEIPFELLKKLNHVWFLAHQRDNELWFNESSVKHDFDSIHRAFQEALDDSSHGDFRAMAKKIDEAGERARHAIDLI